MGSFRQPNRAWLVSAAVVAVFAVLLFLLLVSTKGGGQQSKNALTDTKVPPERIHDARPNQHINQSAPEKASITPEEIYLVFPLRNDPVTLTDIEQRFGSVENFKAKAHELKTNPALRKEALQAWHALELAGITWDEIDLVFVGRRSHITQAEITARYGSVARFKAHAGMLRRNPIARDRITRTWEEIASAGITREEFDSVYPGRNDHITLADILKRSGSVEQFKTEASVLTRDLELSAFARERAAQKIADSESEGYKRIRREDLRKVPPEDRLALCQRERDRMRGEFSCVELVESLEK